MHLIAQIFSAQTFIGAIVILAVFATICCAITLLSLVMMLLGKLTENQRGKITEGIHTLLILVFIVSACNIVGSMVTYGN